jgi:hypothetical protein
VPSSEACDAEPSLGLLARVLGGALAAVEGHAKLADVAEQLACPETIL